MKPVTTAIIIDGDEKYRRMYASCFGNLGVTVMESTNDPMTALKAVTREVPSIIIMDIVLPRIESLDYIRMIKNLSPKSIILVSTYFINDYIRKLCLEAGIERFINKPVSEEVLSLILAQYVNYESLRISFKGGTLKTAEADEHLIDELFRNFYMPIHMKGYMYIKYSIITMLGKNVPLQNIGISRELYPELATMLKTTPPRIERSIRYCIECISETPQSADAVRKYLGLNVSETERPTNAQFLVALALYAMTQLSERNGLNVNIQTAQGLSAAAL